MINLIIQFIAGIWLLGKLLHHAQGKAGGHLHHVGGDQLLQGLDARVTAYQHLPPPDKSKQSKLYLGETSGRQGFWGLLRSSWHPA